MAREMEVSKVVHLSSSVVGPCPYCGQGHSVEADLGERINHYLGHGLKLLHVGTETSWVAEGVKERVWHNTVAVLGK